MAAGDEDYRKLRNILVAGTFLRQSEHREEGLNREKYYRYLDEYRKTKHDFDGYRRETRHGVTEFLPKLTKFLDTPEGKRMQKIDDYKKRKGLDRKEREIKEIDQYGGDKAKRERLANEVSKLKEQMVRELDAMSEE